MQVSFLLANRFPMLLWWGPTFCSIYNDAYIPVLGTKHPWALGRPVSEVRRLLGVSAAQVYLATHRVGAVLKREIRQLETRLALPAASP